MLRTSVVIIILIIILRASVASPFGALLGYLWFALFRPQEWLWIDISQLRLSLVLGGILLIRSFINKSWPDIAHPLSKGIIFFLVTGLMAQGNASNQTVGWQWLEFFSCLSLVSLLLVTLVDSEKRFYYVIITIASCLGYYTAKAGLVSLLGGGVRFADGLAGAYVDNNGYALAAVMIIPLLFATASNVPQEWPGRKIILWGYRVAIPLTTFAVICTFSRGGLLALIASAVTFIMFQKKRFRILAALLILLVLLFPFIPLPQGYQERVKTINTYDEEGEKSALSRLHFWRVAWDMALDNPLGVGMCNFESAYDRYDFSDGQYGRNRAVHNSHLQVLTEEGFLGGAVWIGLFISAFRTCFRIRRLARASLYQSDCAKFYEGMATALIISMVGFLVGGSFIALALNDLTWIIFALVAALERLCIAALPSKEHKTPENLGTFWARAVSPAAE